MKNKNKNKNKQLQNKPKSKAKVKGEVQQGKIKKGNWTQVTQKSKVFDLYEIFSLGEDTEEKKRY